MKQNDDFQIYKDLIFRSPNKIQIRIPLWVNRVLENDLSSYTFSLETQPNMTTIVTKILGSFNEFRKQERETKIKILKAGDDFAENVYNAKPSNLKEDERLASIDKNEKLFISKIKTIVNNDDEKIHESGTIRINIHKTISNAAIISSIEQLCNGELTVTKYIKDILMWYSSFPGYKREQILFTRTVKDINEVLKDKNEKTYFYDVVMKRGFIKTIKPYALVHDPDGTRNYLIGITPFFNKQTEKEEFKATSLRLDNIETSIESTFCINDKYISGYFTNEEKNILELMIKNNPAYIYFSLKSERYVLRFNKIAETKYSQIYVQRPKYVEKIENNDGTVDYVFDCSTKQINQYLVRLMTSFNNKEIDDAYIELIEPQGFKDNFKDYYLKFIKVIKN